MTPEQRRSLRAHLLASGIAGETATTRENTVANAEKLAEGDPDKHLGVGARGRDAPGVMEAVAALCGCSASLDERAGGVKLQTPLDDGRLDAPSTVNRRRRIRYLDGVAVLMGGADLLHTHESWPMDRLLDEIEAPDLVLGDHGWAGAAIMRGIEVVCFTDVNDPAIAVAKADGLVDIVVPCDDNLPPASYDPVRDYLLGRLT